MSHPSSRTASLKFSLSSREQRTYSLARAILAAAHDKDGGVYDLTASRRKSPRRSRRVSPRT